MVNIYNKKSNALHYAIAFFSGLTLLAVGMIAPFPSVVVSLDLIVPLIVACGVASLIALVLACKEQLVKIKLCLIWQMN